MKKIISALLAVMMIASAAAAEPQGPRQEGPPVQGGGSAMRRPPQGPPPPGPGPGAQSGPQSGAGQRGPHGPQEGARPARPQGPWNGPQGAQGQGVPRQWPQSGRRPGPGGMPPWQNPGYATGWGGWWGTRLPRRYRDRDWDSPWLSGLIGLIVGTIISGQAQARPETSVPAQESRADEVKRAAENIAEEQTERAVQIIKRDGPDSVLKELNDSWQQQRQATFLDAGAPVGVLKVAGFQQDLTITYTLDRNERRVTVDVEAPYYGVSESRSAQYDDAPLPAQSVPRQRSAAKLMGFSVSEEARASDGCMIVQSVAPATAAAYAGLKEGSVLKSIDGNSTAQVSVEQMAAYMTKRSEADAVVKITFTADGKEKTAPIKP